MPPQLLPFDDFELLLVNTALLIYFAAVILANVIGMLIRDTKNDKENGVVQPDGGKYVMSWWMFSAYAIASAISTMAILESVQMSVWESLFLSWVMGAIFYEILPKILDLASEILPNMLTFASDKFRK